MSELLPIEEVVPQIVRALASVDVVLRAPPGAGKTTRVPLALLDAAWLGDGRILMLEPRRLAARAAATRMAALLGEAVGRRVGYRMRHDTRVSADTRIEVVTEGILTRMLQNDPALGGVSIVIFDEFHERSIHADLGLTLALNARALLRPDLRLLIMSATLDTDAIGRVLPDATVITSEGRAWPVETHWLDAPAGWNVESIVTRTVVSALSDDAGDVLVFLPGAAEIRRVEASLRSHAMRDVDVYPLYGQLPQDVQDRAISPSPPQRRKVVLATSIAETSLTIEGVRIVVDSGLMRIPRFSARTGMSRLETVRVTRASADQRRGRAGRTAPGTCYRMWTRGEDAGLVPYRSPEILDSDLAPLALELALWGVRDPADLPWIDPPPDAAFKISVALLHALEAVDHDGAITAHGRSLAALGLHPRLAHMIVRAQSIGVVGTACDIAAILSQHDIFRTERARDPDLQLRVEALHRRSADVDAGAVEAVRREAAQWRSQVKQLGSAPSHKTGGPDAAFTGTLLGLAYPDRIAQRRPGAPGRFLMRNGRGASCDAGAALAHAEFIAIAALDDAGRDGRIMLAASLDRADIETYFAEQIEGADAIVWDDAAGSAHRIRTRSLGAIVLEQVRVNPGSDAEFGDLLLEAVRRKGVASLPWPDDAIALRNRVEFARHIQPEHWPEFSQHALEQTLDDWLRPFLEGKRKLGDVDAAVLRTALFARLTFEQQRALDAFAPTHFAAPTGSRIGIDYSDPSSPAASVRLQEMFGLGETPKTANGTVPVTLHLLSPANRPVQVTRDLPGFWKGSYADVRKDLRGRYPRHDWPLDPANAVPSRRPRRRGD